MDFLPQEYAFHSVTLHRDFLLNDTMILQRISIIVEDAGSYPGPLPQKSGSLPMSHNISNLDIAGDLLLLLVPEGDVYSHVPVPTLIK